MKINLTNIYQTQGHNIQYSIFLTVYITDDGFYLGYAVIKFYWTSIPLCCSELLSCFIVNYIISPRLGPDYQKNLPPCISLFTL